MRCTPKPDTSAVMPRIFALMGAGVVVFFAAVPFASARTLLQAAGVLFFGLGIFLTVRYVLTSFSYALVPRGTGDGPAAAFAQNTGVRCLPLSSLDFTVHRQRGRGTPLLEACLSLSDLTEFLLLPGDRKERRQVLETHTLAHTYHYTVSFRPERLYLALFADGEEEIGILFEPSEEMAAVFFKAAERNKAE